MKRIVIGILAHVDAGKTTLSEAMLVQAGVLSKAGRVDRRDTFLDTASVERRRGITVFSKQACFSYGETEFTLLDTPGHVDFSAEAERTLQVLDAAILVISGSEGVQSHTETLWQLLAGQNIPVFLFINKMDMARREPEDILRELQRRISSRCVSFTAEDPQEEAAAVDEALMESYLQRGGLTWEALREAVAARRLFPCFFGSALRHTGVAELLTQMDRLLPGLQDEETASVEEDGGPADVPLAQAPFGARVFKIERDEKGIRLTHMKVVSGMLHVRDIIDGEKVSEIRLYSGPAYETVQAAAPGQVCAVAGPEHTVIGEGIGRCADGDAPETKPVLAYCVFSEDCNAHTLLGYFRVLAEEDPALQVQWDEEAEEIRVSLMGEVQKEVISAVMEERFGVRVTFDSGRILYRETIGSTVEGVGHYEPLRHYAEVHLILEPLPRNSGVVFASRCSEDQLAANWQNLIMTHLKEKVHQGVLIGAPVTDLRITLAAGRAHKKHTEGGDFREATYRAVRQGLMKAESVLLEPWYRFRMAVPQALIGRTMADMQRMGGTFEPPVSDGDRAFLTGRVPVAPMRDYPVEFAGYTRGEGEIALRYDGYDVCQDAARVIEESGYQPERDLENTPDSVFCEHGSGFVVHWDRVEKYMHLPSVLSSARAPGEAVQRRPSAVSDEELRRVVGRAGGAPREKRHRSKPKAEAGRQIRGGASRARAAREAAREECYVIDGYNLIFAAAGQKGTAGSAGIQLGIDAGNASSDALDAARDRLAEVLENYSGYTGRKIIVVFDAYKRKDAVGSCEQRGDLQVVYTAYEQTADAWIEKFTHEQGERLRVRVVTSDALEQMIAMGHGAMRISSREFLEELEKTRREIAARIDKGDKG